MHSILLIVQEPKQGDRDAIGKWQTLWQDHEVPKLTIPEIERLGIGILLIQLPRALPTFCGLVARADHWGVPYRVLFFEEEPQWFGSWKDIPELTVG